MASEGDPSLFTSLLGAAVAILAGLFGFTNMRIQWVRDELKAEIDARSGEHRQGQQQLWSEFRLAEIRANEHRQKLQEKIGELATREDLKQAVEVIEKHMETMLRGGVHR